ncbi:hypothetical protein ABEB36_014829 [Hypothenemus hampei]|uniref:Serpin domain-containing protein n=1 Tax=Hypothenemus hampei TaxID=57062 RepID=A0ABD1E0Y7_HYPHA
MFRFLIFLKSNLLLFLIIHLNFSVVTSVSVVMDASNKKNAIFTDAVGRPLTKPQNPSELASPIELLNPDRYEFYTFDDHGDLVKRLMSLEEIRSIIATGDSDFLDFDSFTSQGFLPEKRVSDIVNNVQNVVKDEMEILKDPISKPIFDTPDVSDSWSMILPAVFGNSGEDIKPEKPVAYVTPDTIMIEPSSSTTTRKPLLTPSSTKKPSPSTKRPVPSTKRPSSSTIRPIIQLSTFSTSKPIIYNTLLPLLTTKTTTSTAKPIMNVEIITNGVSTQNTSPPFRSPTNATSTSRPISVQWSTVGFTPTENQDSTSKTSIKSSSTIKPNIFGLSSNWIASTTLKSKTNPTKRPGVNIFGFPIEATKNNPPVILSASSVAPVKSTTILDSTKSQIKIKPLLSSASTTSKIYSTSTTTQKIYKTETTTTSPASTFITPDPENVQIYNILKNVLAQTQLSENSSVLPSTSESEELTTSASSISEVLSFESNKIPTASEVTNLNTDVQQDFTLTSESTKLPPILHSLNDKQKISASELLDQLLLTTNIYEINTELIKSNTSETTVAQSTTQKSEHPISTLEPDYISETPTTDITLIQSIEQLLSQAVGNVETIFNQTTENAQNAMLNLSKEAEIELTTPTTEFDSFSTTTIRTSVDDISTTNNNLGGSVEALLSQVVDSNNKLELTEKADEVVTDEHTEENTQRTTDTQTSNNTNADQQTTAYYFVVRTEPQGTTTEESPINTENTTIMKLVENINRTNDKPAKADLSLEQLIDELKNLTQETDDSKISTETSTEITTVTSLEPLESITLNRETTSVEEQITTTQTPESTTINLSNSSKDISTKTTVITTSLPSKQKNSTQDQTWTLVSTLAPQLAANQNLPPPTIPYPEIMETLTPVDLVPKPMQGFGLEESTSTLDVDVHQFIQLCNELAFGFWKTVTTGLSPARSIFVSPFAATSMLAMVFLGAKGATSEEMNEILKLDDMVTFNPHLTFKSVSESIIDEPNSGIATTAIIRELFSDRSKGKLLDFYKNRVKAFYDGFAEEVSYREIGDVIRRRTNLLVKKYTNGKYPQFLADASIVTRPPLSGVSINIFETDCSQTSTESRDGELHFIVFPAIKQRRLVPVPAVVYKSGFLAGYEPSLDATAVALGTKDQVISTILVISGQQGVSAPGDGLARLEKRLVESSFKKGAWSRLLRSLIPRPGLEVQIPRFSHRSVINATNALQRMGLHELFNPNSADLRGLNGVANELHLSDVLQINKFATCGEKRTDEATQHSEIYPATTMRARSARRFVHASIPDLEEPRDYQRAFHDPLHDPTLFRLPLSLRPRQARVPEVPRLRFDRPFLYFVRHNPTGLILHMGRFNPRLLP